MIEARISSVGNAHGTACRFSERELRRRLFFPAGAESLGCRRICVRLSLKVERYRVTPILLSVRKLFSTTDSFCYCPWCFFCLQKS